MERIVKYLPLSGTHLAELAQLVNEHIGQGWQPLGGVAVLPREFPEKSFFLIQPMVRKVGLMEEPPSEPESMTP